MVRSAIRPNSEPRLISFFPGFHADLNAMYPVGQIDADSERLIKTTREALDEAIKMCKPGALFRDIGKVMYVPLLITEGIKTSLHDLGAANLSAESKDAR